MERNRRIQNRWRKLQSLKRIKQKLPTLHGAKNQTIHQTFPGIKKLIPHNSGDFSKDKLLDFLEKWWHKDLIIEKTEEEFVEEYKTWAKEKRYHPNANKAKAIYKIAEDSI